MIHLTADTQIFLSTQPADFRQEIDCLAPVFRSRVLGDPSLRTFFFINRSKTMICTLVYDGTDFWLMTKRLSAGELLYWTTSSEAIHPIAAKQLRQLLIGDRGDLLGQKIVQ